MPLKANSRRQTDAGGLALVKLRDGSLLRTLREGKSESQRQVARSLDISHGHYADIERGARQPSVAVARRIATHFGLSNLAALFEEIPLEFGNPDDVD